MNSEPDADWYLDHVLYYAEPGSSSPIRVDEAVVWDAWWRARAGETAQRWPQLAGTALGQGFVLRSAQLGSLSVSRATTRGLVGRGEWSAVARGAVALVGSTAITADQPDRWTQGRRAHALACAGAAATNPGHVVTGGSAAILHGLPVLEQPSVPGLTVPHGRSARRSSARVADIQVSELTAWFGIPVTTVARSVIDVAREDRRAGIVVADAALRTSRVSSGELDAALDLAHRWPGVRRAREVTGIADPRAESPLESLLRLAILDAGLPAPQLQVELAVPGRRQPYRVDMLWPEQRLIVEADGRMKYRDGSYRDGRTADDARWAEKERERALRRLGYTVERVVWSDVVRNWPATYALLADALCV